MLNRTTVRFVRRLASVASLFIAAFTCSAGTTFAQDTKYPEHSIRLIIPFAPGAGNDILGREIANGLSEAFGQSVVPENQGGAGGTIGLAAVARSKPDGYTIGMGSTSTLAINPAMQTDLPYKISDFSAVTLLAETPYILTIGKARQFATVKDLIDFAKKNPGTLTYGSAGVGTTNHLAGAIFSKMAGISMTHIPYAGANVAVNDTIGGHIDMTFAPILSAIPQIDGGLLKPLGVTSIEPSSVVPSIPTIAKAANLPGYNVSNWYGVVASAGTPQPIIDKLNKAIVAIMRDPKIKKELEDQGATVVADSPSHFADTIKTEADKWLIAVRDAGLAK